MSMNWKFIFNRIRTRYSIKACNNGSCRQCHAKHHTLLRITKLKSIQVTEEAVGRYPRATFHNRHSAYCADEPERVMLSIAIVYIINDVGRRHEHWSLLNQDFQINIIKISLAKRFKLSSSPCRAIILDVGAADTSDPIHGRVRVELAFKYTRFRTTVSRLLMDKVIFNIAPIFRIS